MLFCDLCLEPDPKNSEDDLGRTAFLEISVTHLGVTSKVKLCLYCLDPGEDSYPETIKTLLKWVAENGVPDGK